MTKTPRQFDFGRRWKKHIRPLLDHPDVVTALTGGLMLGDPNYREGDPPWECGRGPLNGQKAKARCLSWYQPLGMCHYIAPFCWKLGTLLFPEREWGFITSERHTVAIGYAGDWEEPEWVMDILLFKKMTAAQSLALAKSERWRFYRSFAGYAASFCTDPEYAYEMLSKAHRGTPREAAAMVSA